MRHCKMKTIRRKITILLIELVLAAMLLTAGISCYTLFSMRRISVESSRDLGETAAENAEKALEELAAQDLLNISAERAAYIEEQFSEVESYVRGIASQAQHIYENPNDYPDRIVALPEQNSGELAAQLLWSADLEAGKGKVPEADDELLKLGNLQDMLVQYNANNAMVSSAYIATESGWMIQADYIAGSKYEKTGPQGEKAALPKTYEAKEREWYRRAKECFAGQVIYTDIIRDIHEGGDCIVCACPVYGEGELRAVAGVGSYLHTVEQAVLNTTVGKSGYAFLINEKGQIIASGRKAGETAACTAGSGDLARSKNTALAEAAKKMGSGEQGFLRLKLDDREVYLAYAPLPKLGWSFAAVIGVDEVTAPALESQRMILKAAEDSAESQSDAIKGMLLAFAAAVIVVMALICAAGTLFSGKLTKPIRRLTEEVAKTGGGNLGRRIYITTGDEVEDLGNAFNRMSDQIQEYVKNLAAVTAEKERIRTEIEVAARLQADMLPGAEGIFRNREEFTIAAFMTPAKGVGGDFYDFFFAAQDRLVLVVADVSGKGVPAALFMVVSRTIIKSRLMSAGSDGVSSPEGENALAEAVEEINNILCDNNPDGMFVTAWIGALNLKTGRLVFVNAGHCRPLVCHRGQDCVYETSFGGPALAALKDIHYRQAQIRLRQRDTLLLYTDGVTEATSPEKKLYGEKRLKTAAEEYGKTGTMPEELIAAVREDVEAFRKDAEQFDDITMLAVTYYGKGFMEKTGKPDMEHIREFSDFIEKCLKEKQVPVKTALKLHQAADEIMANICSYSGAEEATVSVRVEEEETGKMRTVSICFADNGIPFDPVEKPDPDVEELLRERKPGGLGIYLVKKRMDNVTYRYEGGRNCLTILKRG